MITLLPRQRVWLLIGAASVAWLLNGRAVTASDWPAYRHDVQRSAATDDKLSFPLQPAWEYRCAQAPRPAWPQPFHILNRLDFDYAPHPVTGGGMVFFASTADDAVRALDEKTGELRWQFVTGGPVRFAPQFSDGRIYAASDDGFVYCLQAADGKVLWKFRAAPDDDLMVGNGRMISRWPIRTGVAVMDKTVYCAAGMWNADGVHACALKADTGSVVWRNDTAGYIGMSFKGMTPSPNNIEGILKNPTHHGEFGVTGLNPQGAALADGGILLIPNGITFPSRFDRHTGQYIPWSSQFCPPPGTAGSAGGTWASIDGKAVYSMTKYRNNILGLIAMGYESAAGRLGWPKADLPQVDIRPAPPGLRNWPKDYIHDKGKASILVNGGKVYSRHAYALALAGDTLLVGLDGAVVAQDASTGKELWRAPVNGIAREIAIANGRVIVSTESGVVYSFVGGSGGAAPAIHDPAAATQAGSAAASSAAANRVIEQVRAAGMDCGFALVLGDADAQVSLALVAATRLNIINIVGDDAAAAALRDRLVTTTNLYGSRITVLPVARLDRLPFARYFANAIVVAGPVASLSGREIYRVLRPCGGILLTPGLNGAESQSLVKECGAPADERAKGGAALARGRLPGALDWDRTVRSDRAATGPMRVLWFGGPGTNQTQGFRQYLGFPAVDSGRYFITGERLLSSVDAYNGTVQWSRAIPRRNRDLCEVNGVVYPVAEGPRAQRGEPDSSGRTGGDDKAAKSEAGDEGGEMDASANQTAAGQSIRVIDAEKAYLVLGKDPDDIWIEFDARTGQQRHVMGKWTPPAIHSLQIPRTWPIDVDANHSGAVRLEAAAEGLILTLTTKDPVVTGLDSWDLYFDLRPTSHRCGLYERGAFQLTVVPSPNASTPASWTKGNGPACPPPWVSGERTADGTKTTVTLAWSELEKIAGGRPTSFGFAATLNSHDGGRDERIIRRHLFGDWASDAMNAGWANVFVGGAPASVQPPEILAPVTAETRKKYPDPARVARNSPSVVDAPAGLGPRIHPLTGELEPRIYRTGTGGCGAPSYTSTSRFGRATGMLGLYDFVDDSGLRNLCGIKAGCSTPITTALGLVIVSPEGGHCICTFPFTTTVTLAPADKRLNEDWAIFHDRPADTLVRRAAINLGAFGDRRDEQGTLWLGFPRPPAKGEGYSFAAGTVRATAAAGTWMRYLPPAMQVPLDIEYLDPAGCYHPADDVVVVNAMMPTWIPNRLNKEFGPYRINTDVVAIAGTPRPWIYGSGSRGIAKATLQLDFRKPLAAGAAAAPPAIDGKLGDTVWGAKPDISLPNTGTDVFLRHDADNLYIAMKRPAVVNRAGKAAAWSKTASGHDAPIWNDDSWEVFLSDAASGKVVHLGVSASGASYDAIVREAAAVAEDPKWNGAWRSAVTADESALSVEMAIPFKTLADAGIQKDRLCVNFQTNQKNISAEILKYPGGHGRDWKSDQTSGEALTYLGFQGRAHCVNFTPLGLGQAPVVAPRSFTVRLHFAELDENAKPGRRVFDVKLQGQTVLKDFDIVKDAGAVCTAIVKEFKGIKASDAMTLEFIPAGKDVTPANAPIISALEVVEEGFTPPAATTRPNQ